MLPRDRPIIRQQHYIALGRCPSITYQGKAIRSDRFKTSKRSNAVPHERTLFARLRTIAAWAGTKGQGLITLLPNLRDTASRPPTIDQRYHTTITAAQHKTPKLWARFCPFGKKDVALHPVE
ncbi:MAG: hypothetical protein JNJ91_00720 [Flavobacteriales bacterium]|nr:hypothetical protein [Flavobacteriales bacterium]